MPALGETVQIKLRMNNNPSRDDMHVGTVTDPAIGPVLRHRLDFVPELPPLMFASWILKSRALLTHAEL